MKNLIIGLITLITCASFNMKNNSSSFRDEEIVRSIQSNATKIINEKFNLQPCGTGVSMPGGPIRSVTLCFNTLVPYTKNQLRELLIKSAEVLLSNVLLNDEIQEFLKDKPFTINNIGIIIYNNDKNGLDVFDPDISVARLSDGTLIFRTTDVDNILKYKNTSEESYEEAINFLKK